MLHGEGETNFGSFIGSRGATCLFRIRTILQQYSETECVEGRPFAMMAAQGSDVRWILCLISLFLRSFVAAGSDNGTCKERFIFNKLSSW